MYLFIFALIEDISMLDLLLKFIVTCIKFHLYQNINYLLEFVYLKKLIKITQTVFSFGLKLLLLAPPCSKYEIGGLFKKSESPIYFEKYALERI